MAHEVVKHVGSRAYRYRVETYRDPASGKVRGRWTYLGRAGGEGESSATRPRRSARDTRERLLAALERLLEEQEYSGVTAGAIAAAAGLAHGTFYRYFADRGAALRAAIERAREAWARTRPSFEPPFGSLEAERVRVRAWVAAVLSAPYERRGLVRAWYAQREIDTELKALQRRNRAQTVDALASYLEGLGKAITIGVPRPREFADALLVLLEGTVRRVLVEGENLDAGAIAGVVDVFDRAIFKLEEATVAGPAAAIVASSGGSSAIDIRPSTSEK
ncbi:MAG: TetR family transcriptional regulator [Candidatus Baltobacteraceae bacterium]